MIILVEGPDCAGKTTYCDWLVKEHRYEHVHFGTFECNPLPNYLELLNSLDSTDDVVIDRMWPSELVYGITLRGVERLQNSYRMLQRAFISLDGVMVMVRTPKPVVGERLNSDRYEMNGVRENWEAIFEAYQSYTPGVPYVEWAGVEHSRMWSPDDLWKHRSAAESYDRMHGSKRARFMIIGEALNPRDGNKFTFCSSSGCSPWFADQVAKTGVPELEICWGNAATLKPDSMRSMDLERVYALGEKAAGWCAKNEVAATEFPHPQYWKRFKWSLENPVEHPIVKDLKDLWLNLNMRNNDSES